LESGTPLPPAKVATKYDSRVEARFVRDFERATVDWDLIREPRPFEAGQSWMFPDFEVRHRHDPSRRWFIEIVGYWSPDYLKNKLEKLRCAGISNFIVCLDKNNACGRSAEWETAASHVIEYSKKIDPTAVLAFVEKSALSMNCVNRL